jgi:hypothetical protein
MQASGTTKVIINYVPGWFTAVPPGPGSIGTPSVSQALQGASALGGSFMFQSYTKGGYFELP